MSEEIKENPAENFSNFSLEAIAQSEELALKEEAKAKKKRVFLSGIIGLGATLAILGILTLFVKFIIPDEPAILSVYSGAPPAKVVKQEKPKKIPPPTAEIPIVSTNTNASVTIDIPEIEIPEIEIDEVDLESEDFEMSLDDFVGLELDGLDSDMSSMFAQARAPKSVVFVIDYSLSMRGRKIELAKKELAKAVKRMKNGTKYQIIFFGGPVWLAEDKVTLGKEHPVFVETRTDINGNTYKRKGSIWVDSKGNEAAIDIKYRVANDATIAESIKHVQENPMSFGTRWVEPVELGLSLKPELIYFMTDGTGGNQQQMEGLAKKAESQNTVINSIAFMISERLEKPILTVAEMTGGLFTVVDKKGEHEIKNLKQ